MHAIPTAELLEWQRIVKVSEFFFEAMGVSVSWLPHAGMVEVRMWACREDWASHAASLSWAWEWRMSGVEKSAHTRVCLSSPLCPQGASLS